VGFLLHPVKSLPTLLKKGASGLRRSSCRVATCRTPLFHLGLEKENIPKFPA
jgi:hypothetical protein